MPEGSSRRPRIPAEQRVFSLILALVASPQGLTKRDLLSSVYGYADRYQHGVVDATLERQFERDKDQVRSLGIHIDTIDSPEESGNTQLTRYRISKSDLVIPAELRLSPDEVTLLRLASLAWAEGSLSVESRRAAMKLEALGAGLETRHLGVAPSLGMTAPQAPALQRAIDSGRVVDFDYQLADRAAPLRRTVEPLQLHRVDGRWHLISWDLDRRSTRVFLLSRFIGEVRVRSTPIDPAHRGHIPHIITELHDLRSQQQVALRVQEGSPAHARLLVRDVSGSTHAQGASTRPGWRDITVGTLDIAVLTEELAGYGSEVEVIDPPQMRERVATVLRRVVSQHTTIEH